MGKIKLTKIKNWDLLMLFWLNVFPIHEKDRILGFLNVSLGCTSKFLSIYLSWKIGIFELHFLSYFVRLWRWSFKLGMSVGEGEAICDSVASFKEKKCSHSCNKFVSVWVLGILFPSLNEGKNCKILLGILMQMLANS